MKKLKGSSIIEVVAGITILAIVFAFVAVITSSLIKSGRTLKVLSIETEIDQLITFENNNQLFKDRTAEYEDYNVEIQFDRDVSTKSIVIGLFEASTSTGKVLTRQEFVFLDKNYE